jgi:hypothetical protein
MARRRGRRPAQRAPSAAQIAASEKAWDEALGQVEGLFAKGQLVQDYEGRTWKLTRGGRRYHEDVRTMLYPAMPARASKDFAASQLIRQAIDRVLREGTHEPGSRGLHVVDGKLEPGKPCPVPAQNSPTHWQDARPSSLATFPSIEVCGRILRAVRPNYDDAPSVAWIDDAKLARAVMAAIEASPKPVWLPQVTVRLRGAAAAAVAMAEGMRALCVDARAVRS